MLCAPLSTGPTQRGQTFQAHFFVCLSLFLVSRKTNPPPTLKTPHHNTHLPRARAHVCAHPSHTLSLSLSLTPHLNLAAISSYRGTAPTSPRTPTVTGDATAFLT